MKVTLKVLMSIFVILVLACEKEKPESDNVLLKSGQLLVGYWDNPQYEDTVAIYSRANNLDENGYSFYFDSNNIFVERKNAGWCGTPPISYTNFEGTWEQESDSIVNITTGYWGGIVDYQWEILELNQNTLKIALLKQDYHSDF